MMTLKTIGFIDRTQQGHNITSLHSNSNIKGAFSLVGRHVSAPTYERSKFLNFKKGLQQFNNLHAFVHCQAKLLDGYVMLALVSEGSLNT